MIKRVLEVLKVLVEIPIPAANAPVIVAIATREQMLRSAIHHSPSRIRSKHHKTNSDKRAKREKKRQDDILEPAQSGDIRNAVGAGELHGHSCPLKCDDEVHISGSYNPWVNSKYFD